MEVFKRTDGEYSRTAKMTNAQAREIREARAQGESLDSLAARYNAPKQRIAFICPRGRTYKAAGGPLTRLKPMF